MKDRLKMGRDVSKGSEIAKGLMGKDVLETHNRLCHEGTRQIKKKIAYKNPANSQLVCLSGVCKRD